MTTRMRRATENTSTTDRMRETIMPFSRHFALRSLAAGALMLALTGCSDFLDVENPASLLDEDLNREELLATLAHTTEGNITGTYSSLNVRSGLLSDELFHRSTQLENLDAMLGNRLASNSAVEGHWRGMAQSRWLADDMVVRLSEMVSSPNSDVRIARTRFFGGLARITMADHFNVIVYGPEDQPRGPVEVITDAIDDFDEAATIASAAGDANLEAAALGQLARAYRSLYFEELHLHGNDDLTIMDQAETAARAALAADGGYNVSLQFGAPGGSNDMVFLGGPLGGQNRIDEVYLFLPDPVTGDWDPRIPHEEEVLLESNGETAVNLKFPTRETPLPVSRASEAMLIIAEARLLRDDLSEAVDWINANRAAARARVSSPDYADPNRWPPELATVSDLQDFASSDADEIYAQIRHERRAEFWLELRRWADMRYYRITPYRWFEPNKAAGLDLRWPPSPEEIAQNPNLTQQITQSVYVN